MSVKLHLDVMVCASDSLAIEFMMNMCKYAKRIQDVNAIGNGKLSELIICVECHIDDTHHRGCMPIFS